MEKYPEGYFERDFAKAQITKIAHKGVYIEQTNRIIRSDIIPTLQAACEGNVNAQYNLARCYETGDGHETTMLLDGLPVDPLEIFNLLLIGTSPKEIAYNLKISYPTVNFHMNNLYRKLGIQSRTELFAKYGKASQSG